MLQDRIRFAGDGAPFDATAAPETVVLTADHARLRLTWPHGQTGEIASARLRAACRYAWCTRAHRDTKCLCRSEVHDQFELDPDVRKPVRWGIGRCQAA
ncbi:MAG TPA: hypothetical protein VFV12_08625 [Xanthobacteraceae bacterium]|nr:hypothetical protein [Xanthobacteraceae bacterium]